MLSFSIKFLCRFSVEIVKGYFGQRASTFRSWFPPALSISCSFPTSLVEAIGLCCSIKSNPPSVTFSRKKCSPHPGCLPLLSKIQAISQNDARPAPAQDRHTAALRAIQEGAQKP